MTVSARPTEALLSRARAAAKRWSIPFVRRLPNQTLRALLDRDADAFLVFGRDGVVLTDENDSVGFHAGMAHLRMMRLGTGEGDTLIRVAGIREGDVVIDCTLGLGQDALVLSRAAGRSGRVIGVEKSLPLFALLEEGLVDFDRGEASSPLELRCEEATVFLRGRRSKSADVVFFDPMFSRPKKAQPAFAMLRRYAEHAPLTAEALQEARRVARRAVVVKSGRGSRDLLGLGLTLARTSRNSDIAFAVLEPSGT